MKLAGGIQTYYVYIATNITKSVMYIGVTNNLKKRLLEHEQDAKTIKKHFTGKYNAYYLVYWENFSYVNRAIYREKVLKGWSRKKPLSLDLILNGSFSMMKLNRSFLRQDDNTTLIIKDNVRLNVNMWCSYYIL